MKSNLIKRIRGFTAIELMMALTVVSGIIYMSVNLINAHLRLVPAQTAAGQAYKYSKAVVRYITTHQNLLMTLLTSSESSSPLVATVTPEVLVKEGYLANTASAVNNLNQTPCTVIYYQNNQLQAFVYYRDNNDAKELDQRQLSDGLNHMGAMMGLYESGTVKGAAKDWALDSNLVSQLFVAQGSVDLSQGVDPGLYSCSGSQIANNSYVVNVTNILKLHNQLPNDDTIHQYPDALHAIDDPQNNNRMNNDLNLDYTDTQGTRTQNNIVFQNNPACEMDPNKPATMYAYDATNPQTNYNYPGNSTLGCKNRQLGLNAGYDNAGKQLITVTGFEKGGVQIPGQPDTRPYVGRVRAASIQPTAPVAVGTACLNTEIGKMAKQRPSADPTDVNNLYISQVICMQSPTCPEASGGFCYLPIQSVTINYTPYKPNFSCPAGMFITQVQTNVAQLPDWGTHCCMTEPITGACAYSSAHDHIWEGYKVFNGSQLIKSFLNGKLIDGASMPKNPLPLDPSIYEPPAALILPDNISLGLVNYGYTCEAICKCPDSPPEWAMKWQPLITSITCTNDPSQASIVVMQ